MMAGFWSFCSLICLLQTIGLCQNASHKRIRRYVLNARRWERCVLQWAFRDPFHLFPTERDYHLAKDVVTTAVRAWEAETGGYLRLVDVSPSRFDDVTTKTIGRPADVDIDILFAYGAHGDAETFDGAGGMVAHTAYPIHGLVHFDAGERWTIGGNADASSVDLRYVALHEFGHALGLRHSSYYKSVMNPYYSEGLVGPPQISRDDAQGLLELFSHCMPQNSVRSKELVSAQLEAQETSNRLSSLLIR